MSLVSSFIPCHLCNLGPPFRTPLWLAVVTREMSCSSLVGVAKHLMVTVTSVQQHLIQTGVHAHTHTYIHTQTNVHTHEHTRLHNMYACTHTHKYNLCMFMCPHIHTHSYLYKYAYIHMYTCILTRVSVIYTCLHAQ